MTTSRFDLRKLAADSLSTSRYDQPGNAAFWRALSEALAWAADEIERLRAAAGEDAP